ncbi:MAG: CHASE domain-containing protein, partial [Terriglobales bacterium]
MPAGERSVYFPVWYAEPYRGSHTPLGFDVASEPKRRQALRAAAERGEPVGTGPLQLVLDRRNQNGLLVFLPLYASEPPPRAASERQQQLRGYLSAVFRIEAMLHKVLGSPECQNLEIELNDDTEAGAEAVLYRPRALPRTPARRGGTRSVTDAGLHADFAFDLAGRQWKLWIRAPQAYLRANRSWRWWGIPAAGLLFSGFMSAIFLLILGHTSQVEREVAQRTLELGQKAAAHAESEREVRTLNAELAQRVEEAVAQRTRITALSAEVGLALTSGATVQDMLRPCAQSLVRHLDAAFARIWTLDEPGTTLELQASAGLYTHLDGPHSRVPVGRYKIGLIAEERRPHLTNDV